MPFVKDTIIRNSNGVKIMRKTSLETFENEQTPLEGNMLINRELMQVYVRYMPRGVKLINYNFNRVEMR